MASKEIIQESQYQTHGPYHRGPSWLPTEFRLRYDAAEALLSHNLNGVECFDFGGGDGMMATILADKGAHVTVGDMSHLALRYAREADARLTVVQLRTELPFPANHYHVVTMLETLEHIPDEEEMVALREIFRVIQPGGLFLISVPSDNYPVSKKHYRHYGVDELHEKLTEVGFCVTKTYSLNQYLESLRRFGVMGKAARVVLYNAVNLLGNKNLNLSMTTVDPSKAKTLLMVATKPLDN